MGIIKWKDVDNENIELVGRATYNNAEIATVNDLTEFVSGTHAEILQLKNEGKLVSGCSYTITDYTTIYKERVSGTEQQGDIPYTITLKAISENQFDERGAKILEHPDWEVHYKIDATNKDYAWVTANSKGCIYRLVDSYKNSLPYDFKNIKVRRYKITNAPDPAVIGQYYGIGNSTILGVSVDTSDYKYLYTFDLNGMDASRNRELNIPNGEGAHVVNNYFCDYLTSWDTRNAYQLPNIVISMPEDPEAEDSVEIDIQENKFYGKPNSMTIGWHPDSATKMFQVRNNSFTQAFDNNYLLCYGMNNNTIDQLYRNFISCSSFSYNHISRCQENKISGGASCSFTRNSIEGYFYSNEIKGSFFSNSLLGDFHTNVIESQFSNNEIGQWFNNNTIHNIFIQNKTYAYVQNNVFGTNTTDNYCYNVFEGNFIKNVIGNACKRNKFDSNFGAGEEGGNTIGDNFFKNIIEGHNISGIDFTESEYEVCYDATFGVDKWENTRLMKLNDGTMNVITNTQLVKVIMAMDSE